MGPKSGSEACGGTKVRSLQLSTFKMTAPLGHEMTRPDVNVLMWRDYIFVGLYVQVPKTINKQAQGRHGPPCF